MREGGSLHIAAHGLSRSVGSGRRERSDVAAESTLVFVRGNQTLSTRRGERASEGRWVLCGIPLMSAINAPLIYVYSRALAKRAMHSNAIYIVIFIFGRHALACCSKTRKCGNLLGQGSEIYVYLKLKRLLFLFSLVYLNLPSHSLRLPSPSLPLELPITPMDECSMKGREK